MSVDAAAARARQIAAVRHPLTISATVAPISETVSDTLKELLDAPRSPPFDKVGLACLAWAVFFISLSTLLALTLR
jgi:hypothetical protein